MKGKNGFSLIEMAIVLFIVALLLGGLLPTVSSQLEQQRRNETRKQLDEIQQALVGYAIINGRLPCPASDSSNGVESFDIASSGDASNGICSNFYDSFVPAMTLGVTTGVDTQGKKGFAVDAWGNRIHYAVTKATGRAFTRANGMRDYFSTLAPDLYVCASSPNPSTPSQNITTCGSATILTSTAPAVIYSTGANGGYGGSGADELANANPHSNPTASPNSYEDRVFVSHDQTPTFDDMVVWMSPNILINRMVSAGKLP